MLQHMYATHFKMYCLMEHVEKADLNILVFLFRLGFLIDFLSHAAIVGFMGGAAITISLQQLKGLLGMKKFTKKTDIVSVMRSVFVAAHHGVITRNSIYSFFIYP